MLKFANRVNKMPKSKLATCFHAFGAIGLRNTCLTGISIVKKRTGKIFVQPESVKHRKVADGTRKRQPQDKQDVIWLPKLDFININFGLMCRS